MDWHKLQHKLFAMDPVDPAKELAALRASAQTPTPMEETDYLKESVQVTEGSLPIAINSISDFAKLAGIRLDEKQLVDRAGQAKGSDPMPNDEYGRTENPLKDKLVSEGPLFRAAKTGMQNYNTFGAFNSDTAPSYKPANKGNAALDYTQASNQMATLLNISDETSFASAVDKTHSRQSLNGRESAAMAQAFQNLMLADVQTKRSAISSMGGSKPAVAPKVKQSTASTNAAPAGAAAPTAPAPTARNYVRQNSSVQYPDKLSIKEQLLKKLNDKK